MTVIEVANINRGKSNILANASVFRDTGLGLRWVEYSLPEDNTFEGRVVASTRGSVAIVEFVSQHYNERRFNVNPTVNSLMLGLHDDHHMSISYLDVNGWSEAILVMDNGRLVEEKFDTGFLDFVGLTIPQSAASAIMQHLSSPGE